MEDKVYILHKAMYRLKQAPRAWYSKIDNHLIHCYFNRSENEATLYVKKAKGSNNALVNQFKYEIETKFEMSDLGSLLSRFMHSPSQVYLCITKRTLRHVLMEVKEARVDSSIVCRSRIHSCWCETNRALWLRKILRDLEKNQIEATTIKVDNNLAISMAKNPVQYGRSKHINVKFHAIRQIEKDGRVIFVHCNSDQ
ncbi:uncharacterized protein LOC124896228 [Capsicum annuum]|uniref:uncharacterized protein LOC124896228 n=1 Tax=Capsicum annuum TaxID=4072 RepID=UPI001FB0E08C|nr:uncharacterized protein LOC124896228 [Capsicum annuum]